MSKKSDEVFDVAIVGGGLAGLTAALTLAQALQTGSGKGPWKIALVAPTSPVTDGRTTALLGGSVSHLEKLGVWQECREHAASLSIMRILDGTQRLWRAPPVEFKAGELGLDAFGYNIANAALGDQMRQRIANESSITVIDDTIIAVDTLGDAAILRCQNADPFSAKLIIAADGKKSAMREAAGIKVKSWQYPQVAVALNLTHTVSHNFTSTEFHTEEGPFTVVPMPSLEGKFQSGLVWIMRPEKVDRLLELSPQLFEQRIEEKMQFMLGKITLASSPQQFPMSGMIAKSFAANRIALVGDAAHLFPPIGAQGFNLGLRDVVEICEIAASAMLHGEDPGAQKALTTYERKRRMDAATRTGAVDILNRSLLSDFLPVQAVRGLGLYALAHIPPLRKFLMSKGLATGNQRSSNAA
jgi:2-octaprenyl-6-methoxyphenol hydroxylase